MNKLKQMQTFVSVVDCGSFVAATEITGLSKTAVSRMVSELEQRIGSRLLNRTTRMLSLTDDGRRFYARAKDLLAQVDEFEAEITASTADAYGSLRVNAPLTFGLLHLAPVWAEYSSRHPRVSLDVSLDDRFVDLAEEGYDLGIRINNQLSPSLVSRKLASTRVVLCASPAYVKEHGAPKHPSDLTQHHVIGYSNQSSGNEWEFNGRDGPARVMVRPRFQANNGDTCRIAALNHQGIILQPDFIVGSDIKNGKLVELMPSYRARDIGIHAVYTSRKFLPAKVRLMIDFLIEHFRDPSWKL